MLRYDYLEVTTDASGDGTATSGRPYYGKLLAVEWVDGDLADNNTAVLSVIRTPSGVDQAIHTQVAGEGDDDGWWYPRAAAHDLSAGALTYDNTNPVPVNAVVNGYLQLVVAAGGDTKTGGCVVYMEV